MKRSLRILSFLAVGSLLIVLFALIFNRAGNRTDDDTVRMLEGVDLTKGDYGLILDDFVTGVGPRLITGNEELEQLKNSLWYSNPINIGTVVSQSMFSMMGMPPQQKIASLVRNGATARKFECLSINCINWPKLDDPEKVWGLGFMRGKDKIPGRPVRRVWESFTQYEAYRAAHATALKNPDVIFAEIGDEIPKPPDDGLRDIRVSLPTQVFPISITSSKPDAAAEAKLRDMAEEWASGFGASVTSVYVTPALPLWLLRNKEYVYNDNGSIALSNVSYIDRSISFSIRVESAEAFKKYLSELDWPPMGHDILPQAIAQTFKDHRLDTTCLPSCGGFEETRLIDHLTVSQEAEPSWELRLWQIER